MKRMIVLILSLIMLVPLAACAEGSSADESESDVSGTTAEKTADEAADTYTLRIGHSDTTTNLLHIYLEKFKADVERQTDGRVNIEIYAAEDLGSNAEMAKMVEMGNLEGMMMSSGQESVYAPKMLALSLPFLFSDYEQVYKVLDGEIGSDMTADLAESNLIQIAWWENGLRQITNSVRPIEKPEDLEGLKIRIPDDQMTEVIFEAYGAVPSFYAFSELYDALEEKEFDGQENPVANIYANKFQDVQSYLTMVNYQYQPKNMVFNLDVWNELPEDLQKIVTDCAVSYGQQHRQAVTENEADMIAELEAAGMQISYPDTTPFIEASQSVYDDFYAQYDWAEQLVADIKAAE